MCPTEVMTMQLTVLLASAAVFGLWADVLSANDYHNRRTSLTKKKNIRR